MPQFIIDYHTWWLTFWGEHPMLFWGTIVLALVLKFINFRRR